MYCSEACVANDKQQHEPVCKLIQQANEVRVQVPLAAPVHMCCPGDQLPKSIQQKTVPIYRHKYGYVCCYVYCYVWCHCMPMSQLLYSWLLCLVRQVPVTAAPKKYYTPLVENLQ